ncbi:Hemin receptor precursor [Methylobrevis pamukkalensis]|uniref:Hemin receptor n=2 Tax=Methylobrevis pamukkalensis TaxID=1439726 RepID=A0A1E3H222_9HYPH|nr:Hemin receptor precursor [Methylobrevis pamukkalensis]
MISSVEVEKGPNSTAGGAGVTGGSVTFRTLTADDILTNSSQTWGGRINATTGTNAFDFNGSAAGAVRIGEDVELVAAVGRKRLGDYKVGRDGTVDYDADGIAAYTTQDQWSWLAKATARPADGHELKLSWTGLTTDFATGSGSYIDTDEVTNHTVVADYAWTPDSTWIDLAAKAYYTRTAVDQFRPARARYDAFQVDYAIDTVGATLQNTSRFETSLAEIALTYGGEVFHDKTATSATAEDPTDDPNLVWFGSNPVGERTVGSLFAQAEFAHGDWLKLVTGLRYDAYTISGAGKVRDSTLRSFDDFAFEDSDGHLSPTATLAVTPFDGVEIYGSYENGMRPVNIMEMMLGGSHIGMTTSAFLPNPFLEPELTETFEIGANVTFDGLIREDDSLRLKAAIYHTTVDNYIALASGQFVTEAGNRTYGSAYFNSLNPVTINGLELEAAYDIGVAYLRGALTLNDADYDTAYDALIGTIPGYEPVGTAMVYFPTPKTRVTLDAGVRLLDRALTLGTRLNFVEPHELNTPNDTYALLDVYGSYEVNEKLTLRFAVENVADVAYVDAMGSALSAAPGRTATFGLTARF